MLFFSFYLSSPLVEAEYNVALNKPTSQSWGLSFFGGSSNAVGGCRTGNYWDICCMENFLWFSPWWSVDLLSVHKFSAVRILNRRDCCDSWLNKAEIRIGNSDEGHGTKNPMWGLISTAAIFCQRTITKLIYLYFALVMLGRWLAQPEWYPGGHPWCLFLALSLYLHQMCRYLLRRRHHVVHLGLFRRRRSLCRGGLAGVWYFDDVRIRGVRFSDRYGPRAWDGNKPAMKYCVTSDAEVVRAHVHVDATTSSEVQQVLTLKVHNIVLSDYGTAWSDWFQRFSNRLKFQDRPV